MNYPHLTEADLIFSRAFITSLGENLYKCPDCGEPLLVCNSENCLWEYNNETKKWEHKCKKQ